MVVFLAHCQFPFQETARRICKLSNECKLSMVENEYVESFKPAMMDVVKKWVEGMSFAEILKKTEIFEGETWANKKEAYPFCVC